MPKMLEVINPFNNEPVGRTPLPDKEEMLVMVEKAKVAQKIWAKTPLWKRAKVCYQFVELIKENVDDIATTLTKEMGKPIGQSIDEIKGAASIFRGFVEKANHLYGEVLSTENQPGFDNDLIFTKREPLGVIACVIPFNYPIEIYVQKAAPAIIMGNACIVKAPTSNPLAMIKLNDLWSRLDIPEGLVQAFAADRDIYTEYLLKSPDIAAISMTGSSKAGVLMAQCAAPTLKTICLELGGNDGNIVRADADIDYVTDEMIEGRIYNAGQTCCACKRWIVHESIKDEVTNNLIEKLKKLKIGDPLDPEVDMSTVISEKKAKEVIEQIEHTIEQGATLAYGGTREGAIVMPTVLTDVDKNYDIASDLEVFGPVFPIISFKTDEEAIEIANNTSFGLSSGIITKDLKQAIHMAQYIQAGAVVLNGQSSYYNMNQPFGGYKMSGIGREGTSCTLEELSQVKSYILKNAFDQKVPE
ncbi:MAG TPA: aldehyde dehydrogenase [Mogibacterium sp.]|nr:aldehyde dehydrogenase [Mogibacterium sp.]